MVIDKIENSLLYANLHKNIAKGFNYIDATDLQQIPTGKYEIDGEEIFAIVMEYDTKDISETHHESHYTYIDLQYIISGSELVGVKTLTTETPFEINIESDYAFYHVESDLVSFKEGMFMIFFPDDLHMPCVSENQVSKVKKVVVKIKVS